MTVDDLNRWKAGLPELVGFEVVSVEPGRLSARMAVRPELLAPNGYLHAASVIALADSACGFGTRVDLPEEAKGFTTIELKANFLGSTLDGICVCEARRVHKGRSTQVWDAEVRLEGGEKPLALFRCTQIILY
jgi:1,4-dihydroxy-2-naphthoyl-CoA hydrolase